MFTEYVTDKGLALRVYKNSQNLRQTTQFKNKVSTKEASRQKVG